MAADFRLDGRCALVTGAARGLGQAMAVALAEAGADVTGVDVVDLGETQAHVEAAGRRFNAIERDLRGVEATRRVVDDAAAAMGRLDILINNAGITRDALTARVKDGEVKLMSDEQWDAVLEVNLKGTWLCSQIAAVEMIKQKYGRIVSTASVAAIGHMGQSNYAASKAGVVAVTQTLALELARFNVAVNCIAPGGTKTRMTAAIPENIMANLIERIPLKRFADPCEIAAVHAFLASDEASFITGQCIFVDGGQTVGA